jgi:hypothetical protein
MKYHIGTKLILFSVILFLPVAGISAPITFQFSGSFFIKNVVNEDIFGDQIKVGDFFKGTYTIDSESPNTGTSEKARYWQYGHPYGFDIEINGLNGSSQGNDEELLYQIFTNQGHGHDIQTKNFEMEGHSAYLAQIFLKDQFSSALNNVDISLDPPNLDDYQIKHFFLGFGPDNSPSVVYVGEITDFSRLNVIPEPSSFFLFSVGIFGIIFLKNLRDRVKTFV